MPKNKSEIKFLKRIKPYIVGAGKGCAVFTVLYLFTAFIMFKTNFNNAIMYFSIYLFMVLGSFVSAISSYKKIRRRGFLTGLTASLPYSLYVFFLLCVINTFNISGNILLVFLITLSGGFLGGITAANFRL